MGSTSLHAAKYSELEKEEGATRKTDSPSVLYGARSPFSCGGVDEGQGLRTNARGGRGGTLMAPTAIVNSEFAMASRLELCSFKRPLPAIYGGRERQCARLSPQARARSCAHLQRTRKWTRARSGPAAERPVSARTALPGGAAKRTHPLRHLPHGRHCAGQFVQRLQWHGVSRSECTLAQGTDCPHLHRRVAVDGPRDGVHVIDVGCVREGVGQVHVAAGHGRQLRLDGGSGGVGHARAGTHAAYLQAADEGLVRDADAAVLVVSLGGGERKCGGRTTANALSPAVPRPQ